MREAGRVIDVDRARRPQLDHGPVAARLSGREVQIGNGRPGHRGISRPEREIVTARGRRGLGQVDDDGSGPGRGHAGRAAVLSVAPAHLERVNLSRTERRVQPPCPVTGVHDPRRRQGVEEAGVARRIGFGRHVAGDVQNHVCIAQSVQEGQPASVVEPDLDQVPNRLSRRPVEIGGVGRRAARGKDRQVAGGGRIRHRGVEDHSCRTGRDVDTGHTGNLDRAGRIPGAPSAQRAVGIARVVEAHRWERMVLPAEGAVARQGRRLRAVGSVVVEGQRRAAQAGCGRGQLDTDGAVPRLAHGVTGAAVSRYGEVPRVAAAELGRRDVEGARANVAHGDGQRW